MNCEKISCGIQHLDFDYEKTWQECLKTTKSIKSTKSTNRTEQKDNANKSSKTNHSDKSGTRKSTPRPKSRPKLEKRSLSLMTNPPTAAPWSYDQPMMYNQQIAGSYGMPSPPMLANGPAFIYGHPQMMPPDGVYRGQHHSSSRRSGAANVQYMLGRGLDARHYEQMQQTNNDRRKSQSDLDYLIYEENEDVEEESDEEEEAPSYVPSTPSNSVPRTRKHSNENNPARRRRKDGHRSPLSSPISDAPSSPVFDEPPPSPHDVMLNSPGRVDKPLQRSQTLRDFQVASPPPQRDALAKRKSTPSVSPDMPSPVLLTDVWNDATPTEIDRFMERRTSVQDNRKAVILSLKEMEEKMVKKNSITSSIKNIFRRRNLTEEPIDEDSPYEPVTPVTSTVYNPAPAHNTHKVTAMVHAESSCKLKKSVSLSSRVEEIPEMKDNHQEETPSRQRRASAAAVLGISYDENGDPCSAV
ncbi:uncharacterized protein [Amphiura filiformis]|uniref:uncharacterized protein n=1 Tax=Amphiura filiformis TaxID=82378 RepID=UPI003B21A538